MRVCVYLCLYKTPLALIQTPRGIVEECVSNISHFNEMTYVIPLPFLYIYIYWLKSHNSQKGVSICKSMRSGDDYEIITTQ